MKSTLSGAKRYRMNKIVERIKRNRIRLMRSIVTRGGGVSRRRFSRRRFSIHKTKSTRNFNRNKRTTRRNNRRRIRKIVGGETVFVAPSYNPPKLVAGATNPQTSAMLAQKIANIDQNTANNALSGGELEDGEEPQINVVQFGSENDKANGLAIELTNTLAISRAQAAGDVID